MTRELEKMGDIDVKAPVDFSVLGSQLEQQEIEAPSGVATAHVYGQLLTVYLLQNDLTNAKFLWKRIPPSIKNANAELALIWAVGQKLWQRDFPGVYEALNKEWSDSVKNLMNAIFEITRKRALDLVAKAYSSINADVFATFVGMPVNEALDAAVAQGWTVDRQTRMVVPPKLEKSADPVIPSGQQLARLTDFVSFLEN